MVRGATCWDARSVPAPGILHTLRRRPSGVGRLVSPDAQPHDEERSASRRHAVPIASPHARDRARSPARGQLERAAVTTATALIAIGTWTGVPVLALWLGSLVAGKRPLSAAAVATVAAVLVVLACAATIALTWLNSTYDRLAGRQGSERRPSWLRSLRAEAARDADRRTSITMPEVIVILNVFAAVIGLVVWWALLAGPPAPVFAPVT